MVKKVHGSGASKDWPDLFIAHRWFGVRWVELKRPGGRLSGGQIIEFNKWKDHFVDVWILTSVAEIKLLFGPANLGKYLRMF